jgi:hypothetical protein
MTIQTYLRQLIVQADDIPLTLVVRNRLRKMGFKVKILEPKSNPAFKSQDIEQLKQSGELYEIVNAVLGNLVVSITVKADGLLYPQIGVYRRFLFNADNWNNLIRQFSSTKPIKLNKLLAIVQNLISQANDQAELINNLRELNRKLHWVKTVKHAITAAATPDLLKELLNTGKVIYGDQHHGHVTPAINPHDDNRLVTARCGGPPTCPTCQKEWQTKYNLPYPQKSDIAIAASVGQEVAHTILKQLGGNKFLAMTGAKNLIYLKAGLQFDVSSRLTSNKANKIAIELVDDLYTITCYKYRNLETKKLNSQVGISAQNLPQVFAKMTGLDTHL